MRYIFSLFLTISLTAMTARADIRSRADKKISLQELAAYNRFLFAQNSIAPATLDPLQRHAREGKRTDGVLVMINGHIVYEKYARGYNKDREHIMWSTSKTVMALLYGVAMKEHRFELNDSICKYVHAQLPGQCQITVADLLQWSSGLAWSEEYENGNVLASSVIAMLYGSGHRNMAAYVLSHPLEAGVKPGTSWRYSSGDSILAAKILQKIFAVKDLRPVFQQKLFAPLGVKHATWESDDSGTLAGAYYFFCSARDLARIGQLFLDHGKVNGQQIVAPQFIDFMETIPPAFTMRRPADPNIKDVSGATLWLNKPAIGQGPNAMNVPTPWPYAPEDTVATIGHWGQYLVVIPSMRLVAVRVGDTRDHSFSIGQFIKQTVHLARGEPIVFKPYVPSVVISSKRTSPGLVWKFKAAPLALGYMAESACNCIFVSKSSNVRCRHYSFINRISFAKLKIDRTRHYTLVTIPWLSLFFHAKAKFISPSKGCALE